MAKEEVDAALESAFTLLELSTSPMLDLHGESKESAWQKTELFIEKHYASGEDGIKILHGRGSGALQDMLRKNLPQHPFVKGVRHASFGRERGAVLLVVLK